MSDNEEFSRALDLLLDKMPDTFRVHATTCSSCLDMFESGFIKIMDEMKKDTRINDLFDSFKKQVDEHLEKSVKQ